MKKGFSGIVDLSEDIKSPRQTSDIKSPQNQLDFAMSYNQYIEKCADVLSDIFNIGRTESEMEGICKKIDISMVAVTRQYIKVCNDGNSNQNLLREKSLQILEELFLSLALVKEFISHRENLNDMVVLSLHLMVMMFGIPTRCAVEKVTGIKCSIECFGDVGYDIETRVKTGGGYLVTGDKTKTGNSPKEQEILAYWSNIPEQLALIQEASKKMASVFLVESTEDTQKKACNNVINLLMIHYYRLVKIHGISIELKRETLDDFLFRKFLAYTRIFSDCWFGVLPDQNENDVSSTDENEARRDHRNPQEKNAPNGHHNYMGGILSFLIVGGIVGAVLFFNSDYWAWESIRATENLSSYRAYLKNNPDGLHRVDAQKKISELQDRKYKSISTPRFTPSGVKDFLTDFPEYGAEKIDKLFYEDVERSQDIMYMRSYLEAFPSGQYANQVREDIRGFEQKLWKKNRTSRDENNLQQIMSQIQDNDIRTQIQDRITALYKDFAFVSQKDTKAAYERFIQLCPNAPECSIAKKRIIDIEVAEIAKGEHGTFSGSTPVSYSFGDTATIEIENGTQYSITVRYSGPDSLKVELAPNARQTITIRTGSYKIAVSTSGGRVHPFYGTNEIRAGHYTESFYIRTSRY